MHILREKTNMNLKNEESIEWTECPTKTTEGKLKILVDENKLDENLIKSLEKKFNVKKAVKNIGLDDKHVHTQAITEFRVILTNDKHFWDDKICPLQNTTGIIIIPEKDTDETIKILDTFFINLYNLWGICRYCNKGSWFGRKVKVQKKGFTWKYITYDGKIYRDERIEYEL